MAAKKVLFPRTVHLHIRYRTSVVRLAVAFFVVLDGLQDKLMTTLPMYTSVRYCSCHCRDVYTPRFSWQSQYEQLFARLRHNNTTPCWFGSSRNESYHQGKPNHLTNKYFTIDTLDITGSLRKPFQAATSLHGTTGTSRLDVA